MSRGFENTQTTDIAFTDGALCKPLAPHILLTNAALLFGFITNLFEFIRDDGLLFGKIGVVALHTHIALLGKNDAFTTDLPLAGRAKLKQSVPDILTTDAATLRPGDGTVTLSTQITLHGWVGTTTTDLALTPDTMPEGGPELDNQIAENAAFTSVREWYTLLAAHFTSLLLVLRALTGAHQDGQPCTGTIST